MIYRLFGIGSPPGARPNPNGSTPAAPSPRGSVPSDAAGRLDALSRGRDVDGVAAGKTVTRMARVARAYQKNLGHDAWRIAAERQAWRDIAVVSGAMSASPMPALALMLGHAERRAARSDADTASVIRYQAMHDFDLAAASLPAQSVSPSRAAAIDNWREAFDLALCGAAGASNAEINRLMARSMRVLRAALATPQAVAKADTAVMPAAKGLDNARYMALFGTIGQRVVTTHRGHGQADPVVAGDALNTLLRGRKLDDAVLDELHAFLQAPCDARLDRESLLAQTIVHLARPSRTMAQGEHGTCAAQTMTYLLARHRPADYARLAREAMAPDGRMRLPSGEVIARVPDSIFADGSRRSDVERMLQAALMQAGRDNETQKKYSNALDSFFTKAGAVSDKAPQGLFPTHIARIAAGVFKKPFRLWSVGEPGDALFMLSSRLKDKSEPVLACLRWTSGSHCVSVERVENGRVYYRNPQGRQSKGALPGEAGHRISVDGYESLPAREFEQRLQALVYPR